MSINQNLDPSAHPLLHPKPLAWFMNLLHFSCYRERERELYFHKFKSSYIEMVITFPQQISRIYQKNLIGSSKKRKLQYIWISWSWPSSRAVGMGSTENGKWEQGALRTGRTTAGKHGEQDWCFCSLNNWKNKENKFFCSLKRILITKITPFVKCVF